MKDKKNLAIPIPKLNAMDQLLFCTQNVNSKELHMRFVLEILKLKLIGKLKVFMFLKVIQLNCLMINGIKEVSFNQKQIIAFNKVKLNMFL